MSTNKTSTTTMKLSFEQTKELMQGRSHSQFYNADEEDIEQWVQSHDSEQVPDLIQREHDRVQKLVDGVIQEAPTHGWLSDHKEDGVQRFLFSNVNGMCMWKTKNRKTACIAELVANYNVDVAGIVECGINWGYFKASQTLASLFKLEQEVWSVQAWNSTEEVHKNSQHGGTGMLVFGETIQSAKKHGKDPRNLGRWTWYLLEGEPNHRTRVVTGYQPVKAKPKGLETVYQQYVRYIQREGLNTTPWELFQSDLLSQLRQWRRQGDRIILYLDANEHVMDGQLNKALQGPGLEMMEALHTFTQAPLLPTWRNGSSPIDGIWVTPKIEVTGAKILPFSKSIGDHRSFLLETTTRSTLGQDLPKIVRVEARRLSCRSPPTKQAYISLMEKESQHHCLLDRLESIAEDIEFPCSAADQQRLENLDMQ